MTRGPKQYQEHHPVADRHALRQLPGRIDGRPVGEGDRDARRRRGQERHVGRARGQRGRRADGQHDSAGRVGHADRREAPRGAEGGLVVRLERSPFAAPLATMKGAANDNATPVVRAPRRRPEAPYAAVEVDVAAFAGAATHSSVYAGLVASAGDYVAAAYDHATQTVSVEVSGRVLGTATVALAPPFTFAFVLNQTPIRGRRIDNAAFALGDGTAREMGDVLAQPFIAMRNDHQDALAAGLAVSEYEPAGKSAAEIASLWQWTEARLNRAAAKPLALAETAAPVRPAPG